MGSIPKAILTAFRLRFDYLDGSHSYSELIYLEHPQPSTTDLQLFPNPTTGMVTIQLNSTLEGPVDLLIYNNLGQLVQQTNLAAAGDQQNWVLNLEELASGSYALCLQQAHWQIQQKLIKL